MIQVDMSLLQDKFYRLGFAGGKIEGDNKVLLNSLDQWQRIELMNSYNQGKENA